MIYRISILFVFGLVYMGGPTTAFAEEFIEKAVSLRVLQQSLESCQKQGACSTNLPHFAGLTRITGYVVDKANQDVIVTGEVTPAKPKLYVEDFVIALRNAWLKYARLEGNTYHYANPGCSIDPSESVVLYLQSVGQEILNSETLKDRDQGITKWRKVCKLPQAVQIFGVPPSHFSAVMVKADYDMKRLVDGSDHLKLQGFRSLTDMTLDLVKEDVMNGKAVSVPLSTMNRFWFYPGKNEYREGNNGGIIIEKSEVVLLTEEEHVGRSGQRLGTGSPDVLAKRFADSFSALYPEIGKQRPIYIELENLFRFVALAKILKFKNAAQQAQLSLDFFLEQFIVKETLVKLEVEGHANVGVLDLEQKLISFRLPSCGGVGIDIEVAESNFVPDKNEGLIRLRNRVLNSRPHAQAVFWTIKG